MKSPPIALVLFTAALTVRALAPTASARLETLPGRGLARHDFLYAGEAVHFGDIR